MVRYSGGFLAAHRAGIHRIILPKSNQKDLKEIPDEVREVIEFLLVERIDEVLPLAFAASPQGTSIVADPASNRQRPQTHAPVSASEPTN